MTMMSIAVHTQLTLGRKELEKLLEVLRARGYELVGPKTRGAAITYDTISGLEDLPAGWTDRQEAGTYRLERRADQALFGFGASPQSWKKFLFPPQMRLYQARRNRAGGFQIEKEKDEAPRYAFIGVHPCELQAIAIQDKIFLHGPYTEPLYQARRENAFIVALNCTQAAGTCFCLSMGCGPFAGPGFDLALTEVLEGERHYFVVEVGSLRGVEVMREVGGQEATPAELQAARQRVEAAASQMGRTMDTSDIKELLYRNMEHPRWENVAERCLSCGNCTLVCPTCFCHTIEDTTDLAGEVAERWRKWDSCFNLAHSYIHGGYVRSTVMSRYRQWMTHKLATWIDQFGTSGCVGCGRCITWCPVGIDITEEVAAIRQSERAQMKETNHGRG